MAKKLFSESEMRQLASNPYTAKVTPAQIRFTAAFKSHLFDRLAEGERPVDVFRECGYDPGVLGNNRISGLAYSVRKEAEAGLNFRPGHPPSLDSLDRSGSPLISLEDIENLIQYLEDWLGSIPAFEEAEIRSTTADSRKWREL